MSDTDHNKANLILTRYFIDDEGQLYSLSYPFSVGKNDNMASIVPYDRRLIERGMQIYPNAQPYNPGAYTDVGSQDRKDEFITERYRAIALQRLNSGNRLCFYIDHDRMQFPSSAKLWLDDNPEIHAAVKAIEDLTGVYVATMKVGSDILPCLNYEGRDILSVDNPPKIVDWNDLPTGVIRLPEAITITWRKVPRIDKSTGEQLTHNGHPLFYYNLHSIERKEREREG